MRTGVAYRVHSVEYWAALLVSRSKSDPRPEKSLISGLGLKVKYPESRTRKF
jgi:hypothetical protein